MTFDPTTNRIEFQLLTHEERKALMYWPHGWERHSAGGWQDAEEPEWGDWTVYRGKPAPVVVSMWYNVYENDMGVYCQCRNEADRYASSSRTAVLRIDTINGKRTYTEEPL